MQLVSREILDPSYGLFLYADDDCCTVRLNPDSAVNPVYALSSNWRVHTQPPNGTELIVVPETNVIAQLERLLKEALSTLIRLLARNVNTVQIAVFTVYARLRLLKSYWPRRSFVLFGQFPCNI